jgi:ATP-binding cassette subfamily B protein/subfamily B ATP-binding cassette protein MsbA
MTPKGNDPGRSLGVLRLSRWLIRYALRRRGGMSAVLGLMLLKSGFDVLRPWPMKILVDNVLDHKPLSPSLSHLMEALPGGATPAALLGWCVVATVLFFLGGWAIGLAGSFANINFGQRMVFDLAADLLAHLQRLSMHFHTRSTTGDLVRRVTTDTSCVSTIVKDALLPVLGALISLVVMFGVMWKLSPVLTLLALAVVPMMIFSFHRYAKRMAETSYVQQEAEGRLYDVINQTLTSISSVQLFGREDHGDNRLAAGTQVALAAAIDTTVVQMKFKVLMGLASVVGTTAILWIGTMQALNGPLSVGSLLLFLAYISALYAPLESIMYTSSTIQAAAGSARRVLEILEIDPEVRDAPHARPLELVNGHVKFEHVSFGYEAHRHVLSDVSFEVQPGELVAVVGPTGAGKSTLLGMIPRLFDPFQGRVSIDGRDLRDITVASLRSQISVVPQEPFLFPFTVAQNIAYARPDAAPDEIEAAARAANAHEFIMKMEQGYQSVVGERGATLSGGERQRIAIARALLKDAPILILDEPTSALDALTEAAVMDALERLMAGRTVFVIAHRLSTVRRANSIIVLENGRVVERGSYHDLLERDGLFARLHRLQFGLQRWGDA